MLCFQLITQRSDVLDICLKNYINISEELADRLAAAKPDNGGGRQLIKKITMVM